MDSRSEPAGGTPLVGDLEATEATPGQRPPRSRAPLIVGGIGVVMLIAVGLAFAGTTRLDFDEAQPVPTARPGEVVTILAPDGTGHLDFFNEQAPFGRWFSSHNHGRRVADRWWLRTYLRDTRSSTLELVEGPHEVEALVPADARGSVIAACDIDDHCFKIQLASG